MLQNYMKIAFRNIIKYKEYTLIKISGLVIGLTCCLLIFLYIRFQSSYDSYHKDADRIFRIGLEINSKSYNAIMGKVAFTIAPACKENFPQVEFAVRIWERGGRLVKYKEKSLYEGHFCYADQDVFSVLTIPFKYGNS